MGEHEQVAKDGCESEVVRMERAVERAREGCDAGQRQRAAAAFPARAAQPSQPKLRLTVFPLPLCPTMTVRGV